MLDPQGIPRMIPTEQQQAAIQAGAKPAVKMLDPQGTPRWIPQDQQDAATQAGAKLADQPPPPAAAAPPTPQQGNGPVDAQGKPFNYPSLPQQLTTAREQTKGFIKGGMQTLAGMVDLANTGHYTGGNGTPFSGTPVPTSEGAQHFTNWLRSHAQINNPDQEVGNFVETASEFLPLMGEGTADAASKYATQTDLAKFAQKYPKLAAVWNSAITHVAQTAVRTGAEQGVQTALKTEDPEKTGEAAATGALTGGVLSTVGEAIPTLTRRVGNAISDTIEGLRPGTRTVAGADFATQPKAPAKPVLRNVEDVVQDPATQAVDEALGNIGKTGVAKSINRTNKMRAPEAQIIPPARRLPGRSGFQVGPAAEPTPVVEGQTAFEPGKQQTGSRTVEGKGPGKFDLPQYSPELHDAASEAAAAEGTMGATNPQPEPQGSHREPTWQYRNQVRPGSAEPGTDVAKGPGTMILTDDGQAMSPERARQQLAQYDRVLNDPAEVDEMGVRQHQAILKAREDMAGQLGRYDNFAASQPHFPEHDALEMVRNTDSLGDAGEQLKAAHKPFWQAADEASGNQWTDLREREKWIRDKLSSPHPVGNYDDLQQELKQNQADQMAFFDKYRTTVAPHDWARARSGYQDGIVLSNLDDFLQRKFGGVSQELEQRGIASGNKRQRVFQPGADFNQQLEDFYNDGIRGEETNRKVLQRTIGQDHMDALHDLGIMFNSTERMRQSQNLTKSILTSIHHHYNGVRGILAGGAGGGMLFAHELGKGLGVGAIPMLTGTGAGINRYITERLITDPDFLKTFSYAIKNNVPPRTAGPLLAARIIAQWKNQPLKEQKQQQPPEPTNAPSQ
jgi:hypothetical protein